MTKRDYTIHRFPMTITFPRPILALGGEQKSRFCLAGERTVILSRDFGDLGEVNNFFDYRKSLEKTCRGLDFHPRIIVRDLHPDYRTTRWADKISFFPSPQATLLSVQHHHAHIASTLAERGTRGKVIGLAWDGSGYGDDGAIWGGEFLLADTKGYRRMAHLEYLPLPGGEKAILEPWRMAFSLIYHLQGGKAAQSWTSSALGVKKREKTSLLLNMIDKRLNSPLTSSMGRLFDAVSALLGLITVSGYPAEAAIKLERMAVAARSTETYPFRLNRRREPYIIELEGLFSRLLNDMKKKVSRGVIARKFHNTVINIGAEVALLISRESKIKNVVLSGGVFQNRIIREGLVARLEEKGLKPIVPKLVPIHDGGLAPGQAVVAHARGQD